MGKLLLWTFALIGAAVAIAGAIGAVAYYGGFIDVSADTPHTAIVFNFIQEARERSIDRSAREIAPPADLSDPERVRRGAGNYDAMCEQCHLSPGLANTEIRQGLYPTPPDLSKSTDAPSNAELAHRFWVIKHGIKASAMPAWWKGGMEDVAIWDLVAFLNRLPNLSPEQYASLVATSGGHSHHGMTEPDHDHADHEHAPAPGHVDKPGSKPHTH